MFRREFKDLLTVPDKDYLVVLGYNPEYPYKHVEEWRRREYQELKEKYKIGEDSCTSSLLRYLIWWADPEEHAIPYEMLLLEMEEKGWDESAVIESLERVRTWKIVEIRRSDKREKKILESDLMRRALEGFKKLYNRELNELSKDTLYDSLQRLADVGTHGKLQRLKLEKCIVSRIKIPESVLKYYDLRDMDVTSFIKGMSEEDLRRLDQRTYKILEKIELKGLGLSQRARILAQTYRKYSIRRSRLKLTPEERMQVLNQTIEKLKELPYISKIFVAGSMAQDAYTESSDIDLLIVSDVLPSKDKALNKVARSFYPSIDAFFFTEEEYKELVRNKKLIALTAKVLFEKNSYLS